MVTSAELVLVPPLGVITGVATVGSVKEMESVSAGDVSPAAFFAKNLKVFVPDVSGPAPLKVVESPTGAGYDKIPPISGR